MTDFLLLNSNTNYLQAKAGETLIAHFSSIPIANWLQLLNAYGADSFKSIFEKTAAQKNAEKTDHLLQILIELQKQQNKWNHAFIEQQINAAPGYLKQLYPEDATIQIAKNIVLHIVTLYELFPQSQSWINDVSSVFATTNSRTYINLVLSSALCSNTFATNSLAISLLRFCKTELQKRVNNKPATKRLVSCPT